MSGHTPGPWTAYHNGHFWDITIGGMYEASTAMVHPNAVERRSDEETEANARLVAASPDLLEALIALRDGPQIECVDDDRVQDMIRAAIAKATGANQ